MFGIGDWGLGQSEIIKSQSPINHQSQIPNHQSQSSITNPNP